MQLTDTHIHLYSDEFDADRKKLIEAAINKGISRFFMPNIDSRSIDKMIKVEEEFPLHCHSMIGLHPCSVNENYKAELEEVENWLKKKKFVAIGEIGIDLYWSKEFAKEQEYVFKSQVKLAKTYNLPVVIHTRNAFEESIQIVKEVIEEHEVISNPLKGIFHCFSGSLDQAFEVIDIGFKIGIGGVLTFKNSGLEEVVKNIDLKHIVLETDAPYLAPLPFRGKRNEPEYILHIAQKLADIKQMTVEDIAKITTYNSIEVFGL